MGVSWAKAEVKDINVGQKLGKSREVKDINVGQEKRKNVTHFHFYPFQVFAMVLNIMQTCQNV